MEKSKYNLEIVDLTMFRGGNGFRLHWEDPDWGFGQIDMFYDKELNFTIDSEAMSKEFVKAVLGKLVDNCENFI
jgi:hypothetical protein